MTTVGSGKYTYTVIQDWAKLPPGETFAMVRGLGGCAASHMGGTGTASAFLAILAGRPWGAVTVPALVPCARWLGWSRE
jgi:hypothetical protein